MPDAVDGAVGLATTYQPGRPALLEAVLPHVDLLEVTPDAIVDQDGDLDRDALSELSAIAGDAGIVVHGVGLSLCSHDGWWEPYLVALDALMERVPVLWHSEHLGFTRVEGEFLGTMLPAPRTDEMLEVLLPRVQHLQTRYGVPFLLENVVSLLPPVPGPHSDAAFLNTLCEATGCRLLLDVYNLVCDEANVRLDIASFLDELELDHVHEIHVAGGVEQDGVVLDVHSRPPTERTLALAAQVAAEAPTLAAATFELMEEALPSWGTDRYVAELDRLADALPSGRAR